MRHKRDLTISKETMDKCDKAGSFIFYIEGQTYILTNLTKYLHRSYLVKKYES